MAKVRGMRLAHLCEMPAAAPVLASWFVAEWAPYYGPGGDGDAAADLAACACRDRLPLCLVAVDEDGTVMGTAALKADSVGAELGVGPWLAAVIVGPDQRGRGVATALVAGIEDTARRLGFAAIYTSSDGPTGRMRARDWAPVGTAESLRGTVGVYRRELAGNGAAPNG